MKNATPFIIVLLGFVSSTFAQNDLVNWKFVSNKISGEMYEIRLEATVKKGWHIYSQNPGEGPLPTAVSFKKSPLIILDGSLKEVGSIKKEHSEVFNSEIRYYENTMVLIQRVRLKASVKTAVNGSINYMVCSNKQCLAPRTKEFTVSIRS
ncbi:MAG TPA: protein-disulfide reductase DsbD domain-containing protein [Chitinophagaceae bacterium]|nr:protein-disulfide reductase DsbD domain-containing protein [Chitinophagaceae bacterium]